MNRAMLPALLVLSAIAAIGASAGGKSAGAAWATEFNTDPVQLSSVGRNPFFVLEPGFYRVLRGGDVEVVVTVLNETKMVNGVETRVVEERETEGGELTEISLNYYAINKRTRDVLYFGEAVDNYRNGKVVNHEGTWIAGQKGAKAGLIMPGEPRVGYRHYQEQAPGVALDRAEILSTSVTVTTPAGTFEHCVKTGESSPMIKGMAEIKYFAPGIGLVKFENVQLVEHGFREGAAVKKTQGDS